MEWYEWLLVAIAGAVLVAARWLWVLGGALDRASEGENE